MKIRHIFIVIVLLFVTIACTKTVVYTDDFGHKTSQVEMKGGVPHGKTILYFNDGENILQETNYKKGKMNGYSTRWFFNGGKEYEEYYKGIEQKWFFYIFCIYIYITHNIFCFTIILLNYK